MERESEETVHIKAPQKRSCPVPLCVAHLSVLLYFSPTTRHPSPPAAGVWEKTGRTPSGARQATVEPLGTSADHEEHHTLHVSPTQASCERKTGSWAHCGSGKTSLLRPAASGLDCSYLCAAASHLPESSLSVSQWETQALTTGDMFWAPSSSSHTYQRLPQTQLSLKWEWPH